MPDIPPGFSLEESDEGLILRNKRDEGAVTQIEMSERLCLPDRGNVNGLQVTKWRTCVEFGHGSPREFAKSGKPARDQKLDRDAGGRRRILAAIRLLAARYLPGGVGEKGIHDLLKGGTAPLVSRSQTRQELHALLLMSLFTIPCAA